MKCSMEKCPSSYFCDIPKIVRDTLENLINLNDIFNSFFLWKLHESKFAALSKEIDAGEMDAQKKLSNAAQKMYETQIHAAIEKIKKVYPMAETIKEKTLLELEKEKSASFEKELTAVKLILQCSLCLENNIDAVFDCGHCCCMPCAKKVTECPFCRTRSFDIKKIYL